MYHQKWTVRVRLGGRGEKKKIQNLVPIFGPAECIV